VGKLSVLLSILELRNVGIGTTAPSYQLDVSGDIRATGAVRSNAGLAVFAGPAGCGGGLFTTTSCKTLACAYEKCDVGEGGVYCGYVPSYYDCNGNCISGAQQYSCPTTYVGRLILGY
jgi:hypothetical protein